MENRLFTPFFIISLLLHFAVMENNSVDNYECMELLGEGFGLNSMTEK